ncbi:hypothetical protein GW17_00039845 [Ensete ventricosum]|nr:hypothetical protein GW17_00039845 [Ensete ventricosum]
MAKIDGNSAMIDDCPPPNPGSRAFLSNSINEEFGSKSFSDFLTENENGGVPWTCENQKMGINTKKEEAEAGKDFSNDASLQPKTFDAPKSCSALGLAERMAARKGFNVPKLDTARIPPATIVSSSEICSPYLTIPPGLSPTILLESPVFLANCMVRY